MTEELAVSNRALWMMADDRTAYEESLMMREAQLGEGPPDEEREEILKDIAEIKEKIEAIDRELAVKTDNVAHVLRLMSKTRELIHEERDRLKQKELACERAERSLREYVIRVMRENNWRHMKTPLNTLFTRSTEAVEITDAGAINAAYMHAEVKLPLWLWNAIMEAVLKDAPRDVIMDAENLRVKTEPSLSAIRKALKAGQDVPGADLALHTHLVCR